MRLGGGFRCITKPQTVAQKVICTNVHKSAIILYTAGSAYPLFDNSQFDCASGCGSLANPPNARNWRTKFVEFCATFAAFRAAGVASPGNAAEQFRGFCTSSVAPRCCAICNLLRRTELPRRSLKRPLQNSLALEDFRYFARRSENDGAKSPALKCRRVPPIEDSPWRTLEFRVSDSRGCVVTTTASRVRQRRRCRAADS